MVEIVVSEWGKLDIGVNNVGGSSPVKAVDYTEESWGTAMNLTLKSIMLSSQAEAKIMIPVKYGNIVNTASMSGLIVNKGRPTAGYNTAKAGVIHLTRCLAAEWASEGIRVNSISPGYMNTPAIQLPHLKKFHKAWAEETPMGRLGEVEDLQGALLYLVSEASSFVTGQNMVIDGGHTIW
jgi:NAD(P)-dependent dehydrogenase (short-subunit alcohol dehydrogenase family)